MIERVIETAIIVIGAGIYGLAFYICRTEGGVMAGLPYAAVGAFAFFAGILAVFI